MAKSKIESNVESSQELSSVVEAVVEGAPPRTLILDLSDGRRLSIPVWKIERVSTANPNAAKNLEILAGGEYLHWPDLDFDLHVPELVRGVTGSRKWMASIGREGGRQRSAAKTLAARLNGARGGRPKKHFDRCRTDRRRIEKLRDVRATGSSPWVFKFTTAEFALAFSADASLPSRQLPRLS